HTGKEALILQYSGKSLSASTLDRQQGFSDTSSVISDTGSDKTLADRHGSRKQFAKDSFPSGSATPASLRSRSRSSSGDESIRNSTEEVEPYSSRASQMKSGDMLQTLLQGAPLPLDLPTDRPRLPHRSPDEKKWPLLLGTRPTLLLRDLARRKGADLHLVLLAAWVIVLSRLTGQEDFAVALQDANSASESIFAGESAYDRTLRADFSGEPDTLQLLERLQRVVTISDSHEHSPPQSQHGNSATSVSVAFSWSSLAHGPDAQRSFASAIPLGFELELHVHDADDHIEGVICYTPALFDTTTIERYAGYITSALERMALNATLSTTKLDILPPFEHALTVQAWNATHTPYPSEICLHHLFEQQAARTPDAIAVVHDSRSLTYAELNTRADRLASKLINLGAQPDMLVAISVERSFGMIIGILAILKSGAAYVPLDPFYPSSRLRDILEDTVPTIVVADKTGRDAIGEEALSTIAVVNPNTLLEEEDTQAPRPVGLTSRHLAYVIYTSGSTGKPKGVMVEHQGAVNLAYNRPAMFGIRSDSRYLQFASFSFSHSVSEIFSTLTAGASLYLLRDDIRLDRVRLWEFLLTNSITHISFTSSLLQSCKGMAPLQSLQAIITVGEAVPPNLPLALKTLAPNCKILNNYGSSEITSGVVWTCPENFRGGAVPIGRPIPNKRVYLLDAHRNPVPIGSVGEMFVGGVGLARGYLNQPELTAERFVFDPFVGEADARMYMTGDLARFLPDGNMIYLGRNDHQVKIRGFRIELGEIEARLREHPLVAASVVIAKGEEDNKRLIAYVVSKADSVSSQLALTLRTHLAAQLPEYMVPSAFVRMDAFPVNANGKLDRRALPEPSEDSLARQTYEEPQGEIEMALAAIWADLLQLDQIGRQDSFFALGGHSLMAVQMISKLQTLGYSLSVRALFDAPTLAILAQSIGEHHTLVIPPNLITTDTQIITPELLPLAELTQPEIDRVVERIPGGLANIQDIYALSPLQDGILFHHLLAEKGDPYVVTVTMAFDNKDMLDRYLTAVQQVVDCHDILRTSFAWENLKNSVQIVWRKAPLTVTEFQLDPKDGPITEQLNQMYHNRHYRMDLTQAPLIRFVKAQEQDGRWILARLQHHLISDRSTSEKMSAEIQTFLNGEGHTLPAPEPYRNLIAQVRFGLGREEHERFFKQMLSNVDSPTLSYDMADVQDDAIMVTEPRRTLPLELSQQLRSQARRLGVSLATLCHLAWALVVSRTSGRRSDVVFGTVLLGRMQSSNSNSARALGLFINTLPLLVDLESDNVEESVRNTQASLAALLEHEHASLALAQRSSGVSAGVPLFNTLLNYMHNAMPSETASVVSGVEYLGIQDRTNYPLSMTVEDYGDVLTLTTQTSQPIEPGRVSRYMQQALESLAQALEHDPKTPIASPDVLPLEERTLLLQTWNETQADYPQESCIHQLFEQQTVCTPESIALVHDDQTLTYAELNTRANRLAHHLIQLGVRPDSLVAICVERSLGMIIGILAIMKAGGAYVPLDPSYASERLADILEDAAPILLVADHRGTSALGPEALVGLTVVDPNVVDHQGSSSNPQDVSLTPDHLAYVIYTSGSTGKPKGVLVQHQGAVNLIYSEMRLFQINPQSRLLQFTSLSFDNSVSEIFSALLRGASLYLLQDDVRLDRDRLWEFINCHSISYISLTPAMLQGCDEMPVLESLKVAIVMGEAMPPALPRAVRAIAPNSMIVNAYGPTETVVGALQWIYTPDYTGDIVPIGRPVDNKSVYVLDVYGNPVPLGAVGELFIGGVGVARGYLNRPDLTGERFLPDPFAASANARMYKTGDLVRYLPDGNIVYLGRNDDQVKIRGFRIELGEIEARLGEHPSVSGAVVLAMGESVGKRLIAYVITRPECEEEEEVHKDNAQLAMALRNHLSTRLPDYMVPSAFVRLDAFPLTSNGKIDRRALPKPSEDSFAHEEYEEPQGEIERALASIWADLLRLDRVSRNDSFFALGGHSLMAVQMMNRVAALGAHVPLATLFALPCLSEFAAEIKSRLGKDSIVLPPIVSVPRQEMMPLSFAQQRMWFLAQMDGVSDTYHVPLTIRLRGALNREAWQRAMDDLFVRHEALRTIFVAVNGQPYMKLLAPQGLPVKHIDLRRGADIESQMVALVAKDVHTPFDLTQGPLIRATLIQTADDEHILSLTQHHIVSDGWSMAIMTRELSELYSAHCKGVAHSLPELSVQYPDYTAWQRQWFSGDRLKDQAEYWRKTLTGVPVMIELPTDRPRPSHQSFAGARIPIALDAELTSSLKRLSQEHGVTLFMTILTAWSVVLSRLSGQDDIVIGTPSANRGCHEVETMMGLFVNTLALRVDLSADPTVRNLLDRVRKCTLGAHEHQDLPFEQVVEIVQPPRKMDHTPLFQVIFAWHTNDASDWDLHGVKTSAHELNYAIAKFDLELTLFETENGGIAGGLRYVTTLFDQSTMERHIGCLTAVLREMTANMNQPASAVELLSPEERTLQLHTWNVVQEQMCFPNNMCTHHVFEQQVADSPHAVALIHKDQAITYEELNARANRLAHHLISLGVRPETLVGICVERSIGLIVGILAILKAGGAYLPLDPAHASERLSSILADASPSILIADSCGLAALAGISQSTLPVVDPNTVYDQEPSSNPCIPTLTSENLAYVIYTSGSTGKPKGVMIEHRHVMRLFTSTGAAFNIGNNDTWCLFHSYAFDFSVWEIWGALFFGGKLVIVSQNAVRSLQDLRSLILEHSLTMLNMTPSNFGSLIESGSKKDLCVSLRYVFVGGDTMAPGILKSWFKTPMENQPLVVNVYGVTESTVINTSRTLALEDCNLPHVPIGKRLQDQRTYVLDARGQPVPIGAVGELHISGSGVARGYMNRAELTAERFILDPFVVDAKETVRMYKTGDLVRYLPNGDLMYIGRNDHQVKIRGFRIELGEIQARLGEHPLVNDCIVIVLGEQVNKRLVAYVAAKASDQDQNDADGESSQLAMVLRTHLAGRLPDYMIPSAFVRMDALPLNANGKVDRRALPDPGEEAVAREAYAEPQGEIESAIASIWADLLRLERVSRNDSFFALGGHSLLAVRMLNRIAGLSAQVPLAALFSSPRLSDFAFEVESCLGKGSSSLPPIVSVPRSDMMPLSFAQQRMWFLAQLDGVSDTYHIPMAIRLRGTLNREAWQQAMNDMLARHEALRTVFFAVNGQPYMRILAPEGLYVEHIDLRHEFDVDGQLAALVAKDLNTSFDLAQGPLIRSTLIQTADDEHILSMNQHHIISDGWSMSIMTRELSELYTAYCKGLPNTLPPLTVQYPDYTTWQRQWFSGDRLKEQAEYWRATLTGAPVLTELPTDRPRPARQSLVGSRIPVAFSAELTASLNRLSQEHGVTMFMTVLTAWSAVLSRLSGQEDIVIGTPSANRGRQEMETMMGLFVNTLALRVDLSAEPSVRSLLDRVRQRTLAAYEHQDLPFEQVVEIVQPPRKMDHTPLFQVMFSWQNNEASDWELPDLQASRYKLEYDVVQFDLELDLYEENGQIVGSLSYSTALFEQTTVERYIGYLGAMLQSLTDDVDQPIHSVDIISPEERALVLQTWNATEQTYPTHECMHHLFERQVERTPQDVALVYENDVLSYTELNERANRLAHYLIELGVRPDSRVAICVERSLAMVIGSMAILKAGGAFVPLDPAYASERLRTILSDAAPSVLLADAAGLKSLGQADLSVMTVVDPNRPLSHASTNTEVPGLTSRHLAYIIYTSGSTGKPKGVMLEHRGLANLCQTHTKFCGIHERTRLMQFASFSFDASVWDIMLPLSSGAALYLPPDCIRMDRDALWKFMGRHSITHASFTPSFLQDGKDLPPLNNHLTLILGGEALSPSLLHNLTRQGITVINDYGPTEVTVSAATWRCPEDFEDTIVPIGRPVIHARLYVLDAHRRPVPLGAVGELYVGGIAVARGYLNRPELTSEMFTPDPFSSDAEARMYRTGDLVRYLPDGNILCLGRKDHQVKIRGFRVELGEIEACLMDHPAVSEAVAVVLGEASEKRLVAYVVSEPIERLAQQLRTHVAANLPRYMVPEAFVRLQAMPLTSNDKLDRNALPAPNASSYALEEYDTPEGQVKPELDPTQLAIHTIWKKLLPSSPTWIPLTESFFDLGGHSILATRLIFEMRRVCDVDLPLSIVFRSPTIEGMAKEVTRARIEALEQLETDQDSVKAKNATSEQEKAFDYGADFEELQRTEIQEIYPRVARQDKVDFTTFFLTGATGFLGAFILSKLLVSDPTARVICLARASSEEKALDRVRSCGVAHLTWNEDWVTSGRLSAVKGDLDLDRFGLAPEVWDRCCRDVDIIIHNGAAVNGVLPYDKVRAANVLGTLQGIKMASTYHTKSFHFVSSTSVLETPHYRKLSDVLAQTGERGIPETDNLEGARCGLHSGYGQSKWVAEKLVMASNKNGLPATIIRPGYIVGHTQLGVTNTGDIIWRLIKGCVEIGSAPNMNAPVDFSPVDYVAHCVVSVATTPGTEIDMVYQVTHSITTPFRFNEFFEAMDKYGYKVQTVEDKVWRNALTEHALKSQDTILFPLLNIQTNHLPGTTSSPEMRDVNTQRVFVCKPGFEVTPRMTTELIGTYLAYMVKTGFLTRPTVQGDDVLTLPDLETRA
ncbi:hypothetical protein BGZ68_009184, partial [Mortierella alpina]